MAAISHRPYSFYKWLIAKLTRIGQILPVFHQYECYIYYICVLGKNFHKFLPVKIIQKFTTMHGISSEKI